MHACGFACGGEGGVGVFVVVDAVVVVDVVAVVVGGIAVAIVGAVVVCRTLYKSLLNSIPFHGC